MGLFLHASDVIGSFVEKEFGNTFEYSLNKEVVLAPPAHGGRNMVFPHKVWVGGTVNDQGWRAAKVGKTVVHIIVNEDDRGFAVVEKWNIKKHRVLPMGDTVFEIDFWYDRYLRLWTCLWLDEFGNQHGVAQYAPNKVDMKLLVDRMKYTEPSEYQI